MGLTSTPGCPLMFRRLLILLACNGLILWLIHTVNYSLSLYQLTLMAPGLFLVFPSLNLKPVAAFLCGILSGLLLDATFPVPFGLFAILFALGTGLALQIRKRLHRERNAHALALTHGLNVGLVLLLALLLAPDSLFSATYWLRVLMDLGFSHLVLLLVTPWFFNLQLQTLELAGIQILQDEIETETI
jgi:cell shape-determining protein MreD